MAVLSLSRFRPSPRYDDNAWLTATLEESAVSADGPWTVIDSFDLDPVDADPAHPQYRNFTTENAAPTGGWYRIVFGDADGDLGATQAISTEPQGAYPSTQELVNDSTNTELLALDAEQQDILRDSSIAAIEDYCGQKFDSVVSTRTLDGQGSNVLYLPRRLSRLDGLTVLGNTYPTDSLEVSEERDRIHVKPLAFLGYYEQAMAEVSGERFPSGFGIVQVTGLWGYAAGEFPRAVAHAIRMDMEDQAMANANLLSDSVRAFRRLGLRSINQGDLNVDLVGNGATLSGAVQQVLSPYIWVGQLGALA